MSSAVELDSIWVSDSFDFVLANEFVSDVITSAYTGDVLNAINPINAKLIDLDLIM